MVMGHCPGGQVALWGLVSSQARPESRHTNSARQWQVGTNIYGDKIITHDRRIYSWPFRPVKTFKISKKKFSSIPKQLTLQCLLSGVPELRLMIMLMIMFVWTMREPQRLWASWWGDSHAFPLHHYSTSTLPLLHFYSTSTPPHYSTSTLPLLHL